MAKFSDGSVYAVNSKVGVSYRFNLSSFTGMDLGENNRIPCIINGKVINKCGSAKDAYNAAESQAADDLGLKVDPALSEATNNIISGADGLQGQNYLSAGALNSYAAGGSQLAAAQKILKAKRDDLNRQLAAAGEEKIDFDKAEKDVTDGLQKATLSVISESGGGGNLDNLNAAPVPPSTEVQKVAPEEESTTQTSTESTNNEDLSLYSALSSDTTPEADGGSGITAGGSSPEVKYNYKDNDINQNPQSSIWQNISTRYLRYFPIFGEKREAAKDKKEDAGKGKTKNLKAKTKTKQK